MRKIDSKKKPQRKHPASGWGDRFKAGRKAIRPFYKHMLTPILIITVFSFFKWLMHDSPPMDWLREQAFKMEQFSMDLMKSDVQTSLPVVLVDISQLPAASPDNRTSGPLTNFNVGDEATPRLVLSNLVANLVNYHPLCIGIDIDFSPFIDETADVEPPEGNDEFLDSCVSYSTAGTPIFVGVGRTAGYPKESWLGNTNFNCLAAYIGRLPGGNIQMPSDIQTAVEQTSLPSLSKAMSECYCRNYNISNNVAFGHFLEDQKEIHLGPDKALCQIRSFYVSYHYLPRLKDQIIDAADIISPNPEQKLRAVEKLQALLHDKVVLIGDARFGASYDTACIPGMPDPVPGIYTHACAICTQIVGPLHDMRAIPGIFLAALVSTALLAIKFFMTSKTVYGHLMVEVGFDIGSIVVVLLIAFLLACFNILWLDSISSCLVFCGEIYVSLLRKTIVEHPHPN